MESHEKNTSLELEVSGMHCQSCEILIEKKFTELPGVKSVEASTAAGRATVRYEGAAPHVNEFQKALGNGTYVVSLASHAETEIQAAARPSALQLAGWFAIVLLIGKILSSFGLFAGGAAFGASSTFWTVFLVGLFAATSSCIAMSGGIMLSAITSAVKEMPAADRSTRLRPALHFMGGRLASYAFFGGVIGLLGKALQAGPMLTGAITLIAALYMLVKGLEMLNLMPARIGAMLPKMPKAIGKHVLNVQASTSAFAPFLLGASTFFLPCGFTQALQLYALTTGSFTRSAHLLFGFALGTMPGLLGVALASSALKGKWETRFYRFSGAAVIILGLWSLQNGFTIAGFSLPKLQSAPVAAAAFPDPNVQFDGVKQVIRMKIGVNPAYSPSDNYTVRAGVPVRMEIEGVGTGCRTIFQIPKFSVQTSLVKPVNVVEFTPTETGQAVFSCSMGMFRGYLNVIKNS